MLMGIGTKKGMPLNISRGGCRDRGTAICNNNQL